MNSILNLSIGSEIVLVNCMVAKNDEIKNQIGKVTKKNDENLF
jgi:hypothetical protein